MALVKLIAAGEAKAIASAAATVARRRWRSDLSRALFRRRALLGGLAITLRKEEVGRLPRRRSRASPCFAAALFFGVAPFATSKVAALFRGLAPVLRKEEVGQEVGRVVIWRQHYFLAWALSLRRELDEPLPL